MRQLFHEVTVFESSGFTFIRVAYQIPWLIRFFVKETPLQSCGKAGTTPTPEVREFHFFNNLFGRHGLQCLLNRGIATLFAIDLEGLDSRNIYIF